MAPLDKTVFIDPLDPADFQPSPPGATPGFTQDVLDTLGNAGDSTDGFDELLAGAGQLIDGWDAAAAASDADLDVLLTMANQAKPDSLDNSIAGFVDTIPYGMSIVNDATQLAPPQLLEFPINPDFSGGALAPPVLSSEDFGTVKLGSPPISHLLGTSSPTKTGRTGIENVSLPVADPAIWKIAVVQGLPQNLTTRDGGHYIDYAYTYYLVMTPAKLGQFTAQVNSGTVPFAGFNIITFSVNVIP